MFGDWFVTLIEERCLEEAELAARDYIERFPQTPAGYDLMACLSEVRGEPAQTIFRLRKVVDFMQSHPEMFKPGEELLFQRQLESIAHSAA